MCNHCYHVIWRNPDTHKQGLKCCHCGDYYVSIRTAKFERETSPVYNGPHGLFIRSAPKRHGHNVNHVVYFEAMPYNTPC